ncbi:MAG: PqqD family protein [Clostridia bacterium]|nr:PqqD family protein [Clostridia bacterium]
MKLKYNFVINEVAGSKVAVAVGNDITKFNGFIKMNETGAEIFGLLKENITLENLIGEMLKLYPDSDPEIIKKSVIDFTEQLKASEVLE